MTSQLPYLLSSSFFFLSNAVLFFHYIYPVTICDQWNYENNEQRYFSVFITFLELPAFIFNVSVLDDVNSAGGILCTLKLQREEDEKKSTPICKEKVAVNPFSLITTKIIEEKKVYDVERKNPSFFYEEENNFYSEQQSREKKSSSVDLFFSLLFLFCSSFAST